MADQRYPARRSSGLLTPVLGGLALIAAVVAGIAFRADLWRFLQWLGRTISNWFTDWVPAHRGQTGAIVGFAVVAFLINWVAHIRGRLRAWIFALVVEVGLWVIFWYSIVIPPLNELVGLDIPQMTGSAIWISAAVVVGLTGALFWFLEAREEWRSYRRRHHVDDE